MTALENIRLYVDYHIALSRQIWESIEKLTEAQFLQNDTYSRGSIRNLMVHIVSVDRRWLTALKNLPDNVGHLASEDYPTRSSARAIFENVAKDLTDYMATLNETELFESPASIHSPRILMLMHMVNHGTDHRATVLQQLTEFGIPSFDQDFILWVWNRK